MKLCSFRKVAKIGFALIASVAIATAAPATAVASDTMVWTDSFGEPIVFTAHWDHHGHDSLSDAERDAQARAALLDLAKKRLKEAKQDGKWQVFEVKLIRQENMGSKTKKNPVSQERNHNCWGDGVGNIVLKRR